PNFSHWRIPRMNTLVRCGLLAALTVGTSATHASPSSAALDGRWDATLIQPSGIVVPFRLDISGSGANLKGTFYNGFEPYEQTTQASFENGQLVLRIDHYLTTITATIQDSELNGKVVSQSRDSSAEYGFRARRNDL